VPLPLLPCPCRKLKLEHIDGAARPRSATNARALFGMIIDRFAGDRQPFWVYGRETDAHLALVYRLARCDLGLGGNRCKSVAVGPVRDGKKRLKRAGLQVISFPHVGRAIGTGPVEIAERAAGVVAVSIVISRDKPKCLAPGACLYAAPGVAPGRRNIAVPDFQRRRVEERRQPR
jgi:hypothetical protein